MKIKVLTRNDFANQPEQRDSNNHQEKRPFSPLGKGYPDRVAQVIAKTQSYSVSEWKESLAIFGWNWTQFGNGMCKKKF